MPEPWTWDPPEIMGPRNRRLIAKRLGHPCCSVEVSEHVEALFPARPEERFRGLTVSWLDANTTPDFEGQAGFYASPVGTRYVSGWRKNAAYGTTETELIASCITLLDQLTSTGSVWINDTNERQEIP